MDSTAPGRIFFNTDALPERDRFPAFCEEMFRHVIGADITRLGPMPFRGVLDVRCAGSIKIVDIAVTPATIARRREHIADGNDALVVQLWQQGSAVTAQGSRENKLSARQGWTIDNAKPARIDSEDLSRFLALLIPRNSIARRGGDLGRRAGTKLVENTAFRLLGGYLEGALSSALEDGRSGEVFADHLIDLVNCALGMNQEATGVGEAGGVRAARRAAVLHAIQTRSADPALNALAVAARLGVTPRYVHLLLEETGCSFTHHLLQRRLEAAAALLRDPRWGHRKIAEVAAEAGFADLSYFSRTFRRRYGATPSDIRDSARCERAGQN